jgi:arylsulfatase A-like enzyme
LHYRDCNLVFVSFDALQAAHVGHLGHHRNTTPTIDAIAKNAFTFTNAISVASWTVPASMTWFTGVYPCEHRMVNKFAVWAPPVQKVANLKEMAPNLFTLAEILKQNGYVTGGFTGNAGVSGGFGYEQGFDVYYHEQGIFGSMDLSIPRALEWLKKNRDKKFFLFLHGYDIHGQNTPANGYDYRFVDPTYDKKYVGSELEQEALREEGLRKGQLTMRDADARFWRDIYDEKIQRTDEKFRRFLEEFEKLGVSDKTVFVLTSDHGTELYEHRRFDHGFTLYQEHIHVPLVIQTPGINPAARRIEDRISSIDVMPTMLDLLGIELTQQVKQQLRGTSLTPAIRGERENRDVFSETDYREYTYKRSIVTPDGWKLIYTLENLQRELFNLRDDPGETANLVEKEPKRADELERKLFAHFKSIGHDLTAKRWTIGLNPVYPMQGK